LSKSGNIDWVKSTPFLGVHIACLAAFWTGVSWKVLALCLAMYLVRMFGITAGYHRYLSHKAFKTSRFFQFGLALMGCLAMQKGPLWWAAYHRHHHQHTDQPEDAHSPSHRGLWWAHVGWFLCDRHDEADFSLIKDLTRYPELVWLNHYPTIPGLALAVTCLLALGWQGLIWGFFMSAVMSYHGTFAINSICHVYGSVRYKTSDTSRNNVIFGVISLGEGWHNNHHHYSTSARIGFFWWEIDIAYYVLQVLAFFRIVWELKHPSQAALEAKAEYTADNPNLNIVPSRLFRRVRQKDAMTYSPEGLRPGDYR
jgi:stearoyl-CoA desaturase (delta-9 desaturase)